MRKAPFEPFRAELLPKSVPHGYLLIPDILCTKCLTASVETILQCVLSNKGSADLLGPTPPTFIEELYVEEDYSRSVLAAALAFSAAAPAVLSAASLTDVSDIAAVGNWPDPMRAPQAVGTGLDPGQLDERRQLARPHVDSADVTAPIQQVRCAVSRR